MKAYKHYKHIIVLLADILFVIGAFIFAVFVVDEFHYIAGHYAKIMTELPFLMIIYIVVFEVMGMYKSLWKYASVEELIRGFLANIIAVNVAYIVVMLLNMNNFNYAYYLNGFFFASMATIGMRLSYRFWKFYEIYRQDKSLKERTLIVGAGQAGVMLIDEIYQNKEFNKYVIGFVDDNEDYVGSNIRNVPVLGTTKDICQIAYDNKIDSIIIAIPSLSFQEMTTLLNKVEATGCKIKMMPPFYEMIGHKQDMLKVRDIKIEDLLGREPILLDETGIREYVNGKTILVTGGGGSIGSELCRQLRHFNPTKIVIVDIYENSAYDLQMEFAQLYRTNKVKHQPEIIVLIASVRDQKRIDEIFEYYKPQVVFHAAAHKHVPLMEVSPKEAIKNNVFGTYNIALMSSKHNVEKFVLISTDKAVNPTNVMGATKRMAERIIMAIDKTSTTDYAAVRFGNVLGSNGSVVPLFKKQILDGGPVTVTHPEITRFFMTIPEACQLVIQAGAYAKGGELFVLDMGEQVKILDLAEKLIRLSGFEPYKDITIEFTGLRPGEKMYEELLVDYSRAQKTQNNLIYIEPNGFSGKEIILQDLDLIYQKINNGDDNIVYSILDEYVKSYKKAK